MSMCHKGISNSVIFALIERMTMRVVINMHKHFLSWLWRCHVSLMHTSTSKVLPFLKKTTFKQWCIMITSLKYRYAYHFIQN